MLFLFYFFFSLLYYFNENQNDLYLCDLRMWFLKTFMVLKKGILMTYIHIIYEDNEDACVNISLT